MKIHILQYDDYQMKTTFPPPLYFVVWRNWTWSRTSRAVAKFFLMVTMIDVCNFLKSWSIDFKQTLLVFSDECNFYLNGTINKHNIHFWATENPHWRLECKTHNTRYLTVWAAIGWNGLIGLDISETTMTGDRYCEVLNEYVVPYFRRNPAMHYQQNGASPLIITFLFLY